MNWKRRKHLPHKANSGFENTCTNATKVKVIKLLRFHIK